MAVSLPAAPATSSLITAQPANRNICLVLEYDGSQFHGWQRQRAVPTIQGTLEDCLARLLGAPVTVHGSGRTDAGVHALGQTASFRTPSHLPLRAIQAGLNSLLPPSIAVVDIQEMPQEFHARYSAKAKTYEYRLLNRPYPSPLHRRFCWWLARPLALEPMQAGAALLVGTHDFAAFQASGSRVKTTVRQVLAASWQAAPGGWLTFRITADGFLRGMVRALVGTLVEMGWGKRQPLELPPLLAARDRRRAGPSAPPWGLYLVEVIY